MKKSFLLFFLLTLLIGSFEIRADTNSHDRGEDLKNKEHFHIALSAVKIPERNQIRAMLRPVIEAKAQQNDLFKSHKKEVEEFYIELLSSNEYKERIAKIYMKIFSKEDLIELAKIFNSPAYSNYISKMPNFTKELMRMQYGIIAENETALKAKLENLKK